VACADLGEATIAAASRRDPMRGRTPAGPEYVDRVPGSDLAKERAKVIFETMAGNCRVSDACERLNICEQRFHQLRHQLVEWAVTGMEPRAPGRPAHASSPADEENRKLREELAAKDSELRTTRAREEIALILPHVGPIAAPTTPTSSTSDSLPPGGVEKKVPSQHPSRSQEPRPNRSPIPSPGSMRKTRGKKKSM
jgi:hypothetical protein